MPIVYDRKRKCLIYLEENATSHFWDRLWSDSDLKKTVLSGQSDWFVSKVTKLFLKPGRSIRILEGGCGKGQYVYALRHVGYDAYGLDFAKETVKRIQDLFPELNIQYGDVRNIPFPDSHFHGYWSLGVIEHFYEGYDAIADEMQRVIKKRGYLFITFPCMSPIRRLKAKLHQYPAFDSEDFDQKRFYQFALPHKKVIESFRKRGFVPVFKKSLDGLGGLKRETHALMLKKALSWMEKQNGMFARITRVALDIILAPFFGHSILIVLKKKI